MVDRGCQDRFTALSQQRQQHTDDFSSDIFLEDVSGADIVTPDNIVVEGDEDAVEFTGTNFFFATVGNVNWITLGEAERDVLDFGAELVNDIVVADKLDGQRHGGGC